MITILEIVLSPTVQDGGTMAVHVQNLTDRTMVTSFVGTHSLMLSSVVK